METAEWIVMVEAAKAELSEAEQALASAKNRVKLAKADQRWIIHCGRSLTDVHEFLVSPSSEPA